MDSSTFYSLLVNKSGVYLNTWVKYPFFEITLKIAILLGQCRYLISPAGLTFYIGRRCKGRISLKHHMASSIRCNIFLLHHETPNIIPDTFEVFVCFLLNLKEFVLRQDLLVHLNIYIVSNCLPNSIINGDVHFGVKFLR